MMLQKNIALFLLALCLSIRTLHAVEFRIDNEVLPGEVKSTTYLLDGDFFSMIGQNGEITYYDSKAESFVILDPALRIQARIGLEETKNEINFLRTQIQSHPKFEAGTPNFVGAIGLGTAIDYVRSVGDTTLYESELCSYVSSRLTNEIAGIRLYGTARDKAPIVSFCVSGTSAGDIGTLVDKLAGVAIRTGRMCAEPVMAHYGVEFMCRLSIGLYTTQGELDVAVEAIKKAVTMLR